MYNPQVIVDKMNSWLGCKEGDATHKHIIDTYNAHKPLAQGYKVKYTDAWCATTVSAAFIECNYTAIFVTECSCNRMINLLKQKGLWQENDAYVPHSGDVIFYDWQDSGVGDNVGSSDHVGVVEKVESNIITVIEGNKNDGVEKRTIAVNGKYIRGYGIPKYDEVANTKLTSSVQPKKQSGIGLDLSSYQKSVDFNKVKKAGIDFVILRSTLKSGKVDSKFEQYYSGAKSANIPVIGVYKLSYAQNVIQAQAEAENVIKMLKGKKCDIWLDMENAGGQQVLGKELIAQIITAFLTTCVNKGYDVGIYCNMDWYKNHIKDDIKKICRFWIAKYPKIDDGKLHTENKPNVGEVMWQYTSKGKIDGVSGNVDMNVKY